MTRDARIDDYVARQADFARPILAHLRETIHAACPACEETLKWSMPSFLYKGKILASMAAFKAHATFGFWHAEAVTETRPARQSGMGQFGRIESQADLPPRAALEAMVKKAMALIDTGAKAPRQAKEPKAAPAMPDDLAAALAANPAAQSTYDAFPPSAQRDYLDWIVDAKRPETRARRLVQAVEWMVEGKRRHWKYENC